MSKFNKWKLARKLFTLCLLSIGLLFVNSMAKVQADLDGCIDCDLAFTTCRGACGADQGCYATCGTTYALCLFSEPCSLPHAQPIHWQDDCMTRADKSRALCYQGVTHSAYLECSANGGTFDECCEAVWVEVFNGCL
jgi:hypothetical protein